MNIVSSLVYTVLSFIVGVQLITLSLGQEIDLTKLIFAYLSQGDTNINKLIIGFTGVFIILALLSYLQRNLMKISQEKTISTDTKDGRITVTLSAIADIVKRTLDDVELISVIKPKIMGRRKSVVVNLKIGLREATNIKEFAQNIQKKINEALGVILGKEKEIKINVEVRKIHLSRKEIVSKEIKEKEIEGPFRNYETFKK